MGSPDERVRNGVDDGGRMMGVEVQVSVCVGGFAVDLVRRISRWGLGNKDI